jgi:hypothetical protein
MAGAWRAIAESTRAHVVDRDDLLLLSLGQPLPVFNPAFVRKRPRDAARLIEEVAGHYEQLGMPFALTFRDEAAPGLADACADRGLIEYWQPPLMVLDPIPHPAPAPPPDIEVRGVTSTELAAYLRVLGEGFGMPGGMVERLFGPGLLDVSGFTGFLGMRDGAPVATSALFASDGLAGVYNVATLAEHRGHGIGAAMTWAAASAGRESGLSISVLQASSAGEPVYRAMGYSTPGRYRQFQPG